MNGSKGENNFFEMRRVEVGKTGKEGRAVKLQRMLQEERPNGSPSCRSV